MAERFWSDGYEATGIADLVDATGVGRASLYGAFGSKRAMLLAAVDHYLLNRLEPMMEAVEAGGLDAAKSIFETLLEVRTSMPERAQLGCLAVNSSIELASADEAIADLGSRLRDRHRQAFRVALTAAAEQGEIEGPIDQKVDIVAMLVLGMFVVIRSAAPLEEVQRMTNAAIAVVESWRVVE